MRVVWAAGQDSGGHSGAGAGRGRHLPGQRGVPEGPAAAVRRCGRAAGVRRGAVRPGPHRQAVRLPELWRRARHPHPCQAPGRFADCPVPCHAKECTVPAVSLLRRIAPSSRKRESEKQLLFDHASSVHCLHARKDVPVYLPCCCSCSGCLRDVCIWHESRHRLTYIYGRSRLKLLITK